MSRASLKCQSCVYHKNQEEEEEENDNDEDSDADDDEYDTLFDCTSSHIS